METPEAPIDPTDPPPPPRTPGQVFVARALRAVAVFVAAALIGSATRGCEWGDRSATGAREGSGDATAGSPAAQAPADEPGSR